jgi:hypothetical protein
MLKEPEARDLAPPEAAPATQRAGRLGGMLLIGLAIVAALLGGLIYNGMRARSAAEAALATRRSSKSFIRSATRPTRRWCCRARRWRSSTRRSTRAPAAT